MARRLFVTGFEGGPGFTGHASPSNGNIVTQGAIKRTGNYALRVNAPSGVNSSLNLDTGLSGTPRLFFRGYLYVASAPTLTRTIFRIDTATPLNGYPEVRLTSTRQLTIGQNGTAVATGATQLPLNTWVRIEVGIYSTNTVRLISVRLNGATELDWQTWGGVGGGPASSMGSVFIGALDTGASAMDLYWDDVVIDVERWAGPGEVRLCAPAAVTASADWNLTGAADMVTALGIIDDNATYVACSGTVSGSTQAMMVSVAALGADVTVVRGACAYARVARATGATAQNLDRRWSVGAIAANLGSPIAPAGTAYAWFRLFNRSDSPMGWRMDAERLAEMAWGVFPLSTGGGARVTAFFVEVDVETNPKARPDPRRAFIASCDTGDTSEFDGADGTPTASTTRVRTGTYAIRTFSSGSAQTLRWSTVADPEAASSLNELFMRAYVWMEAYPASGAGEATVEFLHSGTGFNIQRVFGAMINSSGQIAITDRQFSTPTAINGWSTQILQTQRWVKVEAWVQRNSDGATALDGRMKIWLDDVLAMSSDAVEIPSIQNQTLFFGILNNTVSAVNVDWYWDDIAIDYGARVRSSKVLDMVPTATGFHAGAWAPTGAASASDALDEASADDDTSYVVSPLSTNATDAISFVLPDLPAVATQVQAVKIAVRFKRDGAVNGAIQYGARTNNQTLGLTGVTPGASYAWSRRLTKFTEAMGEWTTGLFNGSEIVLQPNQASNASRVTSARVTVEYVETELNNRELVADAIVVDPAPPTATRYFLHGYNDQPTLQPPSHGSWTEVNTWTDALIYRVMDETMYGIGTVTSVHTSAGAKTHAMTFVGPPLAAQTISGTALLRFLMSRPGAGLSVYPMMYLYVVAPNGTVRGTLLPNTGDDQTILGSQARTLGPHAMTPVACQAGDRVVLELGDLSQGVDEQGYLLYSGGSGSAMAEGPQPDNSTAPFLELAIPLVTTPTRALTADALVRNPDLSGPLPVTRDAVADGVVVALNVRQDLFVDTTVFATGARDVSADGLVAGGLQTLDLTADALVQAIRTKDVVGDAVLLAALTRSLVADAVVQQPVAGDVVADGYVLSTGLLELVADALVRQQTAQDLVADGLVHATQARDLVADGRVVVVQATDVMSDAYVKQVVNLDITSDGVILVGTDRNLIVDAIVRVIDDRRDLVADALLRQTVGLDLIADAVVKVFADLREVAADGLIVVRVGTLKARARIISPLLARPRIARALPAESRVASPGETTPRVTEEN